MDLKILFLLSLTHLITDINQGAVPALLPFMKESLGLSYTAAGMVLLASNLTSSIIQPIFGFFSDRRPKVWLIPMGVLVAGLGIGLSGLSPNYGVLLLLVVLGGLGVAAFHPEGFKTAHFFIGQKKASGMSIFSVGGNLGFALGPFTLALVVTHFSLAGTLFYCLPGFFMACFLLFLLPALRYPAPMEQKETASINPKSIASYGTLTLLILIVTMRSWIQMGLVTFIPFYYINYLKGDPLLAGKMVTTFLISGTIGTLLGARLADRWGHKFFLTLTMLLMIPLLILFLQVQGWGAFVVLALSGFVLIASFSVTVVMAQDLLPGKLGMASGLMVGFAIGTGGMGVTLLGLVADTWGVPTALKTITVLPIMGFLLCLFLTSASFQRSKGSPG
ncbi:MAG: MFS transporter [Thermodesulfobacteriota bacterium]|jgi:FSR family fosmidomycin resistance protein-like MFS transporter